MSQKPPSTLLDSLKVGLADVLADKTPEANIGLMQALEKVAAAGVSTEELVVAAQQMPSVMADLARDGKALEPLRLKQRMIDADLQRTAAKSPERDGAEMSK